MSGTMNESNEQNANVNGEQPLENPTPSANGAEGPKENIKVAADLGMIRIPRELLRLKEIGENSDLIGAAPLIYKGAALVSLENAQKIKQNLQTAILKEEDSIAKSALASAYASVMKSEASYIKAVTEAIPVHAKRQEKGRRALPKGATIGPAIDVKSA
jgi:hypothetical protein